MSDPLPWRKHDFGASGAADEAIAGQQASDSVLDRHLGVPVIVQTFDFGNKARQFGTFDRLVDGGDALVVLDGAAWIFFTEDGGNGQQWFMGEKCRDEGQRPARFTSWLAFGGDVSGAWTDRTARYKMVRSPSDCPFWFQFGNAYTRYRRDTIEVPIRAADEAKPPRIRHVPVDSIVSEHFGGKSMEAAHHMERFYFGRGLGKYRWEAWEERTRTPYPEVDAWARSLAASQRCVPIVHAEPPGAGWVMTDCRTWTNLVRQHTTWTAADFGWPGGAIDRSIGP